MNEGDLATITDQTGATDKVELDDGIKPRFNKMLVGSLYGTKFFTEGTRLVTSTNNWDTYSSDEFGSHILVDSKSGEFAGLNLHDSAGFIQ